MNKLNMKQKQTSFSPLKKYRAKVILAPCLKLFECVTELSSPFLVRYIIDEGIKNKDWDTTWKLGLLLFGFAVVGFLITLLAQYLAASVASNYAYDLRKTLFDKMSSLSERQLDSFGREKALTLIGSDSYAMQSGVMMFMRLIFRPPFLLLGSTIISFVIDWRAGLIFLGVILLSALVILMVMVLSPKRYANIQSDLDDISTLGNDALKGARPIRAFNKQEYEEMKFKKVNQSYKKNTISLSKLNSFLNPLTFFFINGGLIAVVWLGNINVANGSLTTGSVVSLISYLVSSLAALMMFSRLFLSLNKAAASKKRIDSFLALEPLLTNQKIYSLKDELKKEPLVSFEDVSFTFGKVGDKCAISDITFELKRGETLGFIGGTGSGKSTVMNLLTRLYDPTTGKILYRGLPLKEYDLDALHKEISFVSQRPSLFKGTIRSNLLLGKEDASEEEIEKALQDACAFDFVMNFPERLDHPVNEGGSNLSGGQKQRLLIARAFLKGGDLLILDDSMSALDYLSERKIRNVLKAKKDLTKIIISQRVSSLHDCDLILVFENGKIVDRGTDASLRLSSSLYKDFASSGLEEEKEAR